MIICSCNVLSDHDVRSIVAALHAARTPAQVHRCLGCAPDCGRCSPTIRRIVADALTCDDALGR
jgi:bacterioferritin-associated ferredoxin